MHKDFRQTADERMAQIRLPEDAVRNILEKRPMKKKISFTAALALTLALVAAGALAATSAFDTLWGVWQDSFARMNTEGLFDTVEEFDKAAFESEYGGIKEDLAVSTVPGENDLSYEQALAIARAAILSKFGTPAEELDAMGVYPRFVSAVYDENTPAEWEFYFTPRTDTDIDLDHDCPAPGEYRVHIFSPGGEIDFCNYYNDDFWPEYALRVWENGSRDYVYAKALRGNAFFTQSAADRRKFISLFRDSGMDVTALDTADDEKLLAGADIELMFSAPEDSLLFADTPEMRAALAEMEKRYGLTRDMLDACCFCAVPSPFPAETTDICFAYNFNIEAERISAGVIGQVECSGFSAVSRLGFYMIRLDPVTLSAVAAVHVPRPEDSTRKLDPALLLGRAEWSAADLPEYEQMMNELRALDAELNAGTAEYGRIWAEKDAVMRAWGGDPDVYWRPADTQTDLLTREQALDIALQAVADRNGISLERAAFVYASRSVEYEQTASGESWVCRIAPDGDSASDVWFVRVSVPDGNAVIMTDVDGNG